MKKVIALVLALTLLCGLMVTAHADGKIKIGDNDLLKVHFYNSALKTDSENARCKLTKIDNRQHIDGMAAFLDSMCVRQKWWNEVGARLTNERRH